MFFTIVPPDAADLAALSNSTVPMKRKFRTYEDHEIKCGCANGMGETS